MIIFLIAAMIGGIVATGEPVSNPVPPADEVVTQPFRQPW